MSFTDYFGGDVVPPSNYAYIRQTLTASTTFVWPEQYGGTETVLASITELASNGAYTITLPPANEVSVGRDVLLVNISAFLLTVFNNSGGTVTTIPAGVSKYVFLENNSTEAGVWKALTYGAGSNALDAASLAGAGLKASSSQLVTNNQYRGISAAYSVISTDRAKLIVVTSGTITVTCPQASTVQDGFWFMLHNAGAGVATVDGFGAETVDGGANKAIAPDESAIFVCNGAAWFTVGYGRSATFVFSEHIVDAAVGDVTLSAADVAGRMLRISGTATANFTVTMPAIDNIYFVIGEGGLGAFHATFKTAIGVGVNITANQNVALYSDGTNINFAVTTTAISGIAFSDGTAAAPSISFSADPDLGLFRIGENDLGFAVGGAQVAHLTAAAFEIDQMASADVDITGGTIGGTTALNVDSPVFTGNPTTTTPALGDNDSTVANTAFVMNAFGNGFGGGGFSFKNKLINGDMRIPQRGTSFVSPSATAYTLDCWLYSKIGAATHTISQDTNVPSVVQAGRFITSSLRLNLTTADNAIAAADYTVILQSIEGYNYSAIAQEPFTLSFWVYATTPGIYCVGFRNAGSDKSYVAEYTINAGATWEFKTITVSASPSAGTWNYTNGIGLSVIFTLAAGATFQTTANAWNAGNFFATANQINGTATGADDFRLTGVQVEAGSVATPFESRLIAAEKLLCERYFTKSFNYGTAPAQAVGINTGEFVQQAVVAASGTVISTSISFNVAMRATPTMVGYNPVAANSQARNVDTGFDCSATAFGNVSEAGFVWSAVAPGGSVVGNQYRLHWAADGSL
jgi:hypothetical protein